MLRMNLRRRPRLRIVAAVAAIVVSTSTLSAGLPHLRHPEPMPQGVFPKEWPKIPPPSADAAMVPPGYRVEVVLQDLIYPTSVEFDDAGNMYVAEAGFAYGDPFAPARILRVAPEGRIEIVAEQLGGPINDLLWYGGRLYISHFGKISALVLQLYFPSRAASGFVMAGFGEGLVAATPERAGQRSFCRVECANDEAHEQSAYLRHRQRDQCCAPFFPTECFRLRSAFARITASIA